MMGKKEAARIAWSCYVWYRERLTECGWLSSSWLVGEEQGVHKLGVWLSFSGLGTQPRVWQQAKTQHIFAKRRLDARATKLALS